MNPGDKKPADSLEGGREGRGKGHGVGGLDVLGGVCRLLSAGQLEMRAEWSWGVRGAAGKPGGLQKVRVLGLSERRGFQGGRWRRAEREDGSLGETTIGVWGDHHLGTQKERGAWPAAGRRR